MKWGMHCMHHTDSLPQTEEALQEYVDILNIFTLPRDSSQVVLLGTGSYLWYDLVFCVCMCACNYVYMCVFRTCMSMSVCMFLSSSLIGLWAPLAQAIAYD
jgi:hypothetical protein